MSKRVSIVDYGSGNLLSVRRALEHCGADVQMATTAEQVRHTDRLILPGVGAFGDCMRGLIERDLIDPLKEVANRGTPFLGICVGMQILMGRGTEFGDHEGLGLIEGEVRHIPGEDADGNRLKAPHIGWNRLLPPRGNPDDWKNTVLEKGLPGGGQVYFVHSFEAIPTDAQHRLAVCDYGGRGISAAIQRDNVIGTQFHPEKSAAAGLALLSRFLDL